MIYEHDARGGPTRLTTTTVKTPAVHDVHCRLSVNQLFILLLSDDDRGRYITVARRVPGNKL